MINTEMVSRLMKSILLQPVDLEEEGKTLSLWVILSHLFTKRCPCLNSCINLY